MRNRKDETDNWINQQSYIKRNTEIELGKWKLT